MCLYVNFCLFFFFLLGGGGRLWVWKENSLFFLLHFAGYRTPLYSQWSKHLSHASISSAFHWPLQILRCSVAVLCLWPFLWRVRQDTLCFLCNIFKCNVLLYFKKKRYGGDYQTGLFGVLFLCRKELRRRHIKKIPLSGNLQGLLFKSKKDHFNLNFKSILLTP